MNLGAFLRTRRFYDHPATVRAYGILRAVAAKLGFQIVLKTFYSPIPDLATLPPDIFDRTADLPGLDFDLDAQLARLTERRAALLAFSPDTYASDNPSYPLLDATVLYAVLRTARPARIVELGSGHSTLVSAQAARENAAAGHPCRLDVYDPYPGVVTEDLPGLGALRRTAAQDVPLDVFEGLRAGDVLFVDTTHTVKLGSDVNHIVLRILPRLAPGVLVHVHDIFIPYEYPRVWAERYGLFWSEQYLLQAFLAMNPGFEILFAIAALHRDRAQEMGELVPGGMAAGGAAFWMRRTDAGVGVRA